MTSLQVVMSIIDGLLAVMLVMLRGISLSPEHVTSFELRRRVETGDASAQHLQAQRSMLPRLLALRRLLEVVLYAIVVIMTAQLFGWLLGGLMAVLLIIVVDNLAERSWLRTRVTKYYKPYEARALKAVSGWNWLKLLGRPNIDAEDISIASKPELLDIIRRSQTVLTHDERQRLISSLSFGDVVVRDIMTPRSMIDSIDQRESIGPLVLDQLHKTGHSRFPVIDSDVDHVVGMLYLHDLVTLNSTHRTAKGAMQPDVYYVREDHDLEHALHAFLRTHHHLFIVVNEFRETVGLLSLEDVIESLLGYQVIDEFDEYHDIRKVAASNPRKSNQPKGRIDI